MKIMKLKKTLIKIIDFTLYTIYILSSVMGFFLSGLLALYAVFGETGMNRWSFVCVALLSLILSFGILRILGGRRK